MVRAGYGWLIELPGLIVDNTEVEALVTTNGGALRRIPLSIDPASAMFVADMPARDAGMYEIDVRSWIATSNNARIAYGVLCSLTMRMISDRPRFRNCHLWQADQGRLTEIFKDLK